jgi:hypothetical protein
MAKRPKPSAQPESKRLMINPAEHVGAMRPIGGSMSDDWNQHLMGWVAGSAVYRRAAGDEARDDAYRAIAAALAGINPQDEIEGMLAANIVAINMATLDALRRAQIPEQTFEGRQSSLSAANKLAGTMARLIEVLDKRRGKGSTQKVTVEHVHVHAGGQAVVGAVEAGGGRGQLQIEGQSHARTDAQLAALRGKDASRDALPVAGGQRSGALPDARRDKSRRTKGSR